MVTAAMPPTHGHAFTPEEVNALVHELMQRGMHPSKIRRYLADYGLKWKYQFVGNGKREKDRRLAKSGRKLCAKCRVESLPLESESTLCAGCLSAKWSA